ncbi:MAG: methylenetetrahydrofolate reductase [Endomicrobiales bacterium]|jgi:5,10-methylenetetrahydrofolate reductase
MLSDIFAHKKFIITAELFPPKGVDTADLLRRADLIGSLVDGINVTDNQRATMRLGSIAVCRLLKERGYRPVMQMTCRDRNRLALQSDLLSAFVLGIDDILVLSGDHPRAGEYKEISGVYDLDPVQLISAARRLESGIDLAGKKLKGAPKYCIGAVVNPTSTPLELQILMMHKKIAAGAQFFQTQTVFDVGRYKQFHEKVKHLPVKILPGVTLLKSPQFVTFLQNLPGVTIPTEFVDRINNASDPLSEGLQICAETIRELKTFADGVHIMAIGSEEYIPEILKRV